MDEIRELLQNLKQLNAEDLERLQSLIKANADEIGDEYTPDNVALLNELADGLDLVTAEVTEREAAAQQAQADGEAARARIAKANGEETEEPETPETPEVETPEDPEAEAATPEEQPDDAVAVTASARRGKIASMARRQGRAKPSPEAPGDEPVRTSLVASGEMRGVMPGTELDKEKLAEAMTETLQRLPVPSGPRGSRGRDVVVASASWAGQYPEDRKATGEFEHDQRMLRQQRNEEGALVATGGICAPVNVDWSIGMIADSDRPLQSALPANQVSRGGLIYRPDLDFNASEAAIGIWTEATDLSPAGATKPIYTISCPSTDTVYVEAITSRLGFGNMQSRFDPETVAAQTDAALAAYARVADNNLLNLIAAQCTQSVTTALNSSNVLYGATRDLATAVIQSVAAFRNYHRAYSNVTLRACFPVWLRDLIKIDLARETAHQQDSSWNSLSITDEQVDDLVTAWGVSPIWHMDGQATTAPGLSGAVSQLFGAQGASGLIQEFPTELVWYLWYEGAFQYLDGGRLDLGIVRDSLLDATNDYEVFVEVFEQIAFRGFTGGAIQFISKLCASGASAATVASAGTCP